MKRRKSKRKLPAKVTTQNVLRERYNFFQRCQTAEENFWQFLGDVRRLAESCDFQNLEDSLVRDRLVFGVNNSDLREQLLNDGGDPPLDDIIQICGELDCKVIPEVHIVNELIIKGKYTLPGVSRYNYKSIKSNVNCSR